jgi:hypothetical protein
MAQHQPTKVGGYDRPVRIVVRLLLFDRRQNQVQPLELHSMIDSGAQPADLDLLSVAVTLPEGNFVRVVGSPPSPSGRGNQTPQNLWQYWCRHRPADLTVSDRLCDCGRWGNQAEVAHAASVGQDPGERA